MPNLARFNQSKNQFITIETGFLRNENLSLNAKGLLALMLTYSNDVNLSLKKLSEKSNVGKYITRNALNELQEHGYVYRFEGKEGGKYFYRYLYDERPIDIRKAEKFIMSGRI